MSFNTAATSECHHTADPLNTRRVVRDFGQRRGNIATADGVVIAEVGKSGPERVRRTNRERIELGRYILAGLELFIVSDIIHTALSLALADLVFLGLLVINPLVAATERQFEILMSRYQTGENRTLSVSGEGLWLRQGSQFGQTVIRAARANSDGTSLFEASFFVFDPEGQAQSPFRGPRSAPPG